QDRNADVWEPIIAVADAIGGKWPVLARQAGIALVAEGKDADTSMGVRLLIDTQTVFENADQLWSKTILARLIDLPESPWADIYGRPLDERGLAKRLRGYGIKPKTIRIGAETAISCRRWRSTYRVPAPSDPREVGKSKKFIRDIKAAPSEWCPGAESNHRH